VLGDCGRADCVRDGGEVLGACVRDGLDCVRGSGVLGDDVRDGGDVLGDCVRDGVRDGGDVLGDCVRDGLD
jgi:hypothetical protein